MTDALLMPVITGDLSTPALVEIARTFIGVPFKHRGRDRKGMDCAGVLWRSYADGGLRLPDLSKYGREPHQNGMMRVVCEALGRPLWTGAPGTFRDRSLLNVGDALVMAFEKEPHHMAIVGTDRHYGFSMIHADGSPGVRRVVEHGLDARWQSRIVAVFRRPI